MEVPRRSLLKASAAALALGTAGCINQSTTEPTPDDGATPSGGETGTATPNAEESIPDGMRSLLDAIPGSVVSEESAVWVYRPDGNAGQVTPVPLGPDVLDPSTVEWAVSIFEGESMPSGNALTVATGEIDTDAVRGDHVRDEGSFSLHERREREGIVAVSDQMAVAGEESAVTSVLDAVANEPEEPLLEAYPAIETALTRLAGFDNRRITPGNETPAELNLSPDEIDRLGVGMQRNGQQRKIRVVLMVDGSIDLTEEKRDEIESGFEESVPDEASETSFSVDGDVLVFEFEMERHSRGSSSFGVGREEYDPETGRLELELHAEEPKSVENLTLAVEGETYDPAIWADGRDTLEPGDTIYIDEADVRPHLELTLEYEGEDGSSSMTRTVLDHLPFEFDYDFQNRALHITYHHGLPLDGDEVYVGIAEATDGSEARQHNPNAELARTEQPWAGDTVTEGTTATLSDVEPGQFVRIGYGGTDREQRIHMRSVPIPIHAAFEHEGDGLTVRLRPRDEPEPLPADSFEIQVEGEPAATQFSDLGETVEPGAALDLTEVETGQLVTVSWNGVQIGETTVLPDVDLSVDFDANGGATLSHDGGDALDPNEVTLMLLARESDQDPELSLSEKVSGDFSEGDSVTVDRDGLEVVLVRYGDEELTHFERPPHPAEATFDVQDRSVTVTLNLDQSYPADTFEVRVDGRPADTQWSDSQDTVNDGDSLTVEDLEYGTRVAVRAGEREDQIGNVLVKPDVDLSFEFETEDGPTLSHDGGEALDPSKMAVRLIGEGSPEPIPLDEKVSGPFSEGDSVTFDRSELHVALVMYDDEIIQEFERNEQTDTEDASGGSSSGGSSSGGSSSGGSSSGGSA